MWKSSKDLKKGKKFQFAWENLKLWTQISVERMVVLAGFRSFEKQSKKTLRKIEQGSARFEKTSWEMEKKRFDKILRLLK